MSPSSSPTPSDPGSSSRTSHPNPDYSSGDKTDAHYPLLGSGKPYNYFTPYILSSADKTEPLLRAFNSSLPGTERDEAARQLFGRIGDGCQVIPPIWVEWGRHTKLGDGVYIGTGVNIQDTGGGESLPLNFFRVVRRTSRGKTSMFSCLDLD